MARNKPKITTGEIDGWTYEVTTTFVQVPLEREAAYWATLKWFAEEILKELQKQQNKIHDESEVNQGEEKTARQT